MVGRFLWPERHPPQLLVDCLSRSARRSSLMGTKSRETIYGASIRAAAERATEARKEADRLACEAWNKRMLSFQGPAQPSPALGDALNAGSISRSEMPGLQHSPDRRARHRAATEDNADPRTGTLHAVQGLLTASRPTVQAQPSCRAANHQNHGERSALDVVAGRAVNAQKGVSGFAILQGRRAIDGHAAPSSVPRSLAPATMERAKKALPLLAISFPRQTS